MPVRELELDLDAFEGPFDLLLSLVFAKSCRSVRSTSRRSSSRSSSICMRRRARPRRCGEFLILIAALLELKARAMFPEEDAELAELEPEEAAEELARRLAEYRRAKESSEVPAGSARGAPRLLLPARAGAARAEGGAKARPAGAAELARGAAGAGRRAARAVGLAHGAAVPADLSVPRPLAALLRAAAASTSTRRWPGSRASRSPSRSWRCSSCASRTRLRSPRPGRSPR